MLKRILLSGVGLFLFSSFSFTQPWIPVTHDITEPTVWQSGNWYRIENSILITWPGNLTIQPNVHVAFVYNVQHPQEPYGLTVQAGCQLTADASTGDPIHFTSYREYVGGPPDQGDWKALIADGTSLNHAVMNLTNCEIKFGGEHETDPRFASGVIRCLHPCDVVVTDCFIHDNWGEGVGTDHDGANENHLELTDCRIENCEIGVKLVLPDANTVVKRNWIESCLLGMRLHTDPDVGPKVANNIIKNCQGNGVEDLITFNSLLAHFNNNVIDNSGSSGMYFTSNIVTGAVQNNIFVNNHRYGIEVINTRSGTVSYNSFYHNTINKYTANVQSRPEVTVNPELTEAFGDENFYHLQWDSPCLEQGNDDPEMHNSNPAESRGDIGAYGGPELEPQDKAILISLSKP